MKKDIVITGAGLVGSLLSIYLAKRGHKVSVYERRPDMRQSAISAGRSINLALSDRGIRALERVGIMEEIRKIAVPMHGRYIHQLDGTHAEQPYGKEGQFINSVSRGDLNKKLMDLAAAHGVALFFEHKCTAIDWQQKIVFFDKTNTGESVQIKADIIFGADGAFSATRLAHQFQHATFNYSQYYIDCGYKELTIPAGASGSFQIEKNALHIWPRKDYMLIALPNLDGSFTCTLFFPFEGPLSFANVDTDEKIQQFMTTQFPDAIHLMPDYLEQFKNNPTSSLVTVKCYPWIREDHFALIGDAAHAIVPFFGQGMNCGFEDCVVLDDLMENYPNNWHKILETYQFLRKPDGDAIADLAINNFTEMRERVADPLFLLQKKIEAKLHELYPEDWIPAYTQVTFSPFIRYSEALSRSILQEGIMKKVMHEPDVAERAEDPQFYKAIIDQLKH